MKEEIKKQLKESINLMENDIDNCNEIIDGLIQANLEYVDSLNEYLIKFDNQIVLKNKILRIIQTLKAVNNGLNSSKLQYHNINEEKLLSEIISDSGEIK